MLVLVLVLVGRDWTRPRARHTLSYATSLIVLYDDGVGTCPILLHASRYQLALQGSGAGTVAATSADYRVIAEARSGAGSPAHRPPSSSIVCHVTSCSMPYDGAMLHAMIGCLGWSGAGCIRVALPVLVPCMLGNRESMVWIELLYSMLWYTPLPERARIMIEEAVPAMFVVRVLRHSIAGETADLAQRYTRPSLALGLSSPCSIPTPSRSSSS